MPNTTDAQGHRFPSAPTKVELSSGFIDAGERAIHAVWVERDLANEGALTLSTAVDGSLAVHRVAHNPANYYGALRSGLQLPRPNSKCTMVSGSLAKPTTGHLIAEASFTCADNNGIHDGHEGLIRTFFVIGTENIPRLLERVTVLPPATGTTTVDLQVRLSGDDLDGDGQPDIRLSVTPKLNETQLSTFQIELIDRPGGLSLRGGEPEATLVAMADQALAQLDDNSTAAAQAADHIATLHSALCRGTGHAQLEIGGRNGLPCPRSVGAGRALSVAVIAHARHGNTAKALTAWEQMRGPDVRVGRKDEARAKKALDAIERTSTFRFEVAGSVPVTERPALHRPPVAFIDEHRLLLRGSPPVTVPVTGEAAREPTSVAAPGMLLTSPDGKHVATEIVQTCKGERLLIYPAQQVVMGRSMGQPAAEVPLNHRVGPGPCGPLSRPRRLDRSHWDVLRWSAGQLTLLQGGALRTLALDPQLAGGPASSPRRGYRPKAGTEPDAISDDAGLVPMITRLGVGLLSFDTQTLDLVATEGLPDGIDAVALSPSGQRMAALVGTRLFVGQRTDPPAP